MKLNSQILFSIILICFALLGKCVDGTPKLLTPLFSSLSSSSSSPTPTPSASSPLPSEGIKTKAPTSYSPEASAQFSDTPYTADSPSDAPTPTTYGSFSDYLKGKLGDNSKIKYTPGLEQICGKTHHPDVCLATISPLLNNKVDVVHVLQAAIAVTTQNAKMVISKIEKHPSVSSEVAASLTDCKDHYNKALGSLQKAREAIQARDFGSVTVMLSGVLADVSSAESKIQDLKTSAFNAYNFSSLVSVTASNSLSIASLIHN